MNARHTYTYDAEGRLATMNGTNLSFSAVYYADGTEAEGASNNGWTQDYVYDAYDPGGQYVLEPWGNQSGGYNAFELVGLGSRHIALYNENNPRGTYFVHPNALGSDSNWTDWKGATNGEEIYAPWGQKLVAGGYVDRFAGLSHRDQTGFDVTPARDYSSTLDRWLTPDPGIAGAEPSDPQSWNAYGYVGNNPTSRTDPSGEDYRACINNGNGGQNCFYDPNDYNFQQAVRESGATLQNGQILATVNGQQVQIGTYEFFVGPGEEGRGMEDQTANVLAVVGLAQAGVKGLVALGEGAVSGIGRLLGVGAEEAAPVAAGRVVGASIEEVVQKASSAVGGQSVTVANEGVARQAAEQFLGPGKVPITERSTGEFAGWKSADGTRVVLEPHVDATGAHMNFLNKLMGSNLHVRW